MLPAPPSDDEKYIYLSQNKSFLYSFGIVSSLLLIIGSTLFCLSVDGVYWYLAFVLFNGFYIGISYLVGVSSKQFDYFKHRRIKEKNFEACVDIFLPTCGESLLTLANTYSHVKNLDWPDFHVWVLDDSERQEVRALAKKYGFCYIARPAPKLLKKAGNIRYAFTKTMAPYFLILDADFCPRKDFLKEAMGYFLDPKVAIVQTPQFFKINEADSYIQKGAASVQELFYRLIQVNRNNFGASICVGTCAIYRRKAFEPLGGTYPIEHSEDVHTGFFALSNGYRIEYVPINLAAGLCPETVDQFLTQQYRWCSGSTSLFFNRQFFWKMKLSIMARLSFLTGMLYYQATALSLVFNPLPGLVMILFFPEKISAFMLIFSFPSLVFGYLVMKLWNKTPYGLYSMSARQIGYIAHLWALKDKLFGSIMPWTPTGTIKKNRKVERMKLAAVVFALLPILVYSGAIFFNWQRVGYEVAPFMAVSFLYSYLTLAPLLLDKSNWRANGK